MHHKSCSSLLLLPLLPALAAPSVTALFPVTAFLLVVAGESITTTESKRCGCETVREVDLGADGVGEVGNDKDVLDVCVAANC
jgi:hypothetical protein